jgi:hypothetical protein
MILNNLSLSARLSAVPSFELISGTTLANFGFRSSGDGFFLLRMGSDALARWLMVQTRRYIGGNFRLPKNPHGSRHLSIIGVPLPGDSKPVESNN